MAHPLIGLVKQFKEINFSEVATYKLLIAIRDHLKNRAGGITGQEIFENLNPGNFQIPNDFTQEEIDEVAYDLAVVIVKVYTTANEEFGVKFALKMIDQVKLTGN